MSRLLKLSTTRKAVVNTFGYDIGELQHRMRQYPAIGWGRLAKLIVVKLNPLAILQSTDSPCGNPELYKISEMLFLE